MSSILVLAAAGPVEQIATTFGANWPALISNMISFVLVTLLLKKFAFGPIQKVLKERAEKIEQGLANAERIKVELAGAQTKAHDFVSQAGVQATRMIEEARTAATSEAEKTRQLAITDAQTLIAKAKDANENELARMKAELRKEFTRLVVETSAKVTADVLTVDQKKRLADDANRLLANN